jgi:hypothetical protein
VRFIYKPLEDAPHLFLEFARLMEQRDPTNALTEWISRRGLLGLYKREHPNGNTKLEVGATDYRRERWWTSDYETTEYMHEGGPSETIANLRSEANSANHVLTNWEAFLSGEPERAEHELLDHFPQHDSGALKDRYISFLRAHAKHLGLTYGEHLLYQVGFQACLAVQDVLEAFTYPYLAFDYRNPLGRLQGTPGPELAAGSWRPRNLLGAMYLQMYHVMISSGEISQCKYCGRTISYAPSLSESTARKPRKDKEFCDSRCRQNYHYHAKIKPAREGKNA